MTSTSSRARLIRLRRPPRLLRAEERFVPPVPLDRVDVAWRALLEELPRAFDGDILHVLGVSRDGHGGVTIHVAPTSYRFYAVQRPAPPGSSRVPLDCGARPLGAKAITEVEGRFLMGRRSEAVAFYPGCWEFLPGGGLEQEDDPAGCALRELAEETELEAVAPPIATALLYDPVALSWEVVHHLRARAGGGDRGERWEHHESRLVERGKWPEPLAEVARRMVTLIA